MGHSRKFKDVRETELHTPGFFYLWPPNLAENESHRIMRQGKKRRQGYGSTGSERGSRGRGTGEAVNGVGGRVSGLVSDYTTYMDFARLHRHISASRTKVVSTYSG